MLRRSLFLALLLALVATPQSQPAKPEVERLNALIEELTALKSQAAAIETRIDTILRSLAEQRGALQQNPPAYNAFEHLDEADPKPQAAPVRRCAAITSSGKRCTRGAMEASRYCKQHQLSHAK